MQESPLMNLVFNKLHKTIVEFNAEEIGVSFPEYKIKLGEILRLHGSEINLQNFMRVDWLDEISEYCDVGNIKNIPSNIKYRTVSRVRPNMSKSKLRRLKKRRAITSDEERAYRAKMFSQGLDNPYVDLNSGSTGQNFRFFLCFGPIIEQPVNGGYDSYGLSKDTTIPWF